MLLKEKKKQLCLKKVLIMLKGNYTLPTCGLIQLHFAHP